MPTRPTGTRRSWNACLRAAVLRSLLGTHALSGATAYEAGEGRPEHLVDRDPPVVARTLGAAGNRPAQDEAPLEAAFRALFCREARDAVNEGRLGRDGRRWILVNGHRCRDERLLFDALGF